VLPHSPAALGAQVLDVGRARVRRPHQHEEARPGDLQRAQRVDAHVGAGREGVGADAGDGTEGRRSLAGQRLAVSGGRDVDVPALGVGEDEQALCVRMLYDQLQRAPTVRAEPLETRELRLDRDAGGPGGVDGCRAVRGDRGGGALGRRAVRGRRRLGLRPQTCGVGIEAQDDLGLPLRDEGVQPVSEMRTGRRPAVLRVAGLQRLVVDRLLQTRAGREPRHLRRRDLDGLTRPRMHALTCTALGDMELAEPGERHIAATRQRLLDGLEDGINGLAGFRLAQLGATGDLIDEL
jgi:hypothetical protein